MSSDKLPAKRGRGRPKTETGTLWPNSVRDEIVARISEGETLCEICRTPGFPKPATVYEWTEKLPDFARAFERARVIGHHALSESVVQIMRAPPAYGPDGKIDQGDVQHRKLQCEYTLKLLAKWSPKLYGDRQQVELTGKDGGPVETVSLDASKLSDTALQELMRARAADAKQG